MKTDKIPKPNSTCLFQIKVVLLYLFFLGLPHQLSAQDTPVPVDTLFLPLKQQAEQAIKAIDRAQVKSLGIKIRDLGKNENRADILNWGSYFIAEGLYRENPTEAKVMADEALTYFQKRGDLIQIGRCYNLLGSVMSNLSEVKQGVQHYLTAIDYFEKAYEQEPQAYLQRRITAALSNIGYAYTRISLYDRAADYLFKAEKKASVIQDSVLWGAILNNIGNVFFVADRFEESRKYYQKLHKLALQIGHQHSLRQSSNSLSNSFLMLGQLDSALYYSKQAVDLLKTGNDNISRCIILSNLANIYRLLNHCDQADTINYKVLYLAQEKQLVRYEALANFSLAECAYQQKEYKKTIRFAGLSYELIHDNGDIDFIKDIHEILYQAYEGENKYQLALKHHQQFKILSDSLLNEKSLAKVQELQTRYDTERKEKEIKLLNETNRIQQLEYRQNLSWLLIALIGLGLSAVVFIFHNRQKVLLTNNQKLEAEQRLLRSQMNPHFIFNALTSIQNFLLQDGQVQQGIFYLSKFAKLIRRILEHSRVTFVSLEDELETLEYYLSLQQLRFEQQFSFQINTNISWELSDILFPPMLLQPAVENAIEHGQLTQMQGGKVSIDVTQLNDQSISIQVKDNGLGRKNARQNDSNKKEHQSLASIIIKERIELLQKTYNPNVSYNIMDAPGGGTIVTYDFPLKSESKNENRNY